MGELGDRLREAREGKGLSLPQVEEATRIRRAFVEALEEERFEELPGDVYARGFVQTYSRLLGLDAQEMLRVYRKLTHSPSPGAPKVLNEPLMPPRRSNLWPPLFLGSMVLVVLGLIGWYAYSRIYLGTEPWPISRPSPAPIETRVFTVAPSGVAGEELATPTFLTTVVIAPTSRSESVILPTRTPTQARTSLPSPTPRPRVTRTATPTNSPTGEPTPTFSPEQGIRVVASVVAPTYVEVTLDGETAAPVILQPGEELAWEARESVAIRIGNAGGLRLTVNGVEVGSLGASGQVVDVQYALDNLP